MLPWRGAEASHATGARARRHRDGSTLRSGGGRPGARSRGIRAGWGIFLDALKGALESHLGAADVCRLLLAPAGPVPGGRLLVDRHVVLGAALVGGELAPHDARGAGAPAEQERHDGRPREPTLQPIAADDAPVAAVWVEHVVIVTRAPGRSMARRWSPSPSRRCGSYSIHATGKTLEQPEVIHHFTFRNGKVVAPHARAHVALSSAQVALTVETDRRRSCALHSSSGDRGRWRPWRSSAFPPERRPRHGHGAGRPLELSKRAPAGKREGLYRPGWEARRGALGTGFSGNVRPRLRGSYRLHVTGRRLPGRPGASLLRTERRF